MSLDTSILLRPDATARDVEGRAASEAERQRFAGALQRAQRSEASGALPTLVRAARTRLGGDEAASALRDAWTAVCGEPPSAETLSILVGQWAHETGRGASMLNYNFGGLKGTGPSGLSTACSTREGWGDSEVRVVDRFRAYGSAEEGARDYVSLLARRYPDAVRAAQNGDAAGFVHGLKARGYFTDNEAAYSRSVQSLARLALASGFEAVGAGAGAADAARGGAARASSAPAAPDYAMGAAAGAPASLDSVGLDALAALAESAGLLEASLGGADSARGTPPLGWEGVLDGGALLERAREIQGEALAGLAVAPDAFTDEVHRAALVMSALRIAEPRSRQG